ncbi:hypothetical protein GOP47_0009255 [Adiantum capillus-veneris]|uniref:Uncharacterized protein n=1 Tax=Adiantum capillus-veneris TaxID=13818 RepID=A0A9D4UWJ6_ADICA|nr:hypothetical protein GOP47_0009255 [Adiantum capillus-veneris]
MASTYAPPNVDGELDHEESQRILREESLRYGAQDLSLFFVEAVEREGLEGEPMKLEDVRKCCPSFFVKDILFRRSGRAKATTPLKISYL